MNDKNQSKAAMAALALLPTTPWDLLSLESVAKKSKLPPKQIRSAFPDTNALIPAIVRLFDEAVSGSLEPPDEDSSFEDLLFDSLMLRFEAMQPYREGLIALDSACRHRPALALCLYRAMRESMKKTLELLGFRNDALLSFGRVSLLLCVYQMVFYRWCDDTTPDLDKTMAALNATLQACRKTFRPLTNIHSELIRSSKD